MADLHLLPSWNDPWAVLAVLAHANASAKEKHHVVAWCSGPGQELLHAPRVSTGCLGKRWPWDPLALGRWWRVLRLQPWRQVHLWGGLDQSAAATLAMSRHPVVLHVLSAGDLETAHRLHHRSAPMPERIELTRPWYDWAAERLSGWNACPASIVPALPLPHDSLHLPESSSALWGYLHRLVQAEGTLVLSYDDGRSAETTKALLWAADILCSTCSVPVQFCFTGPCRPSAAILRFWSTLRTRRHIGWLPWEIALGQVFARAELLWWNDAEDLTLWLPQAMLERRLPVLGWSPMLDVLRDRFPQAVASVEKDPYALAAATFPLLQRAEPASAGVFVSLEPGSLSSR